MADEFIFVIPKTGQSLADGQHTSAAWIVRRNRRPARIGKDWVARRIVAGGYRRRQEENVDRNVYIGLRYAPALHGIAWSARIIIGLHRNCIASRILDGRIHDGFAGTSQLDGRQLDR